MLVKVTLYRVNEVVRDGLEAQKNYALVRMRMKVGCRSLCQLVRVRDKQKRRTAWRYGVEAVLHSRTVSLSTHLRERSPGR